VYDYEEGVKKHTKKIYSEILDVISTILPEAVEEKEEKHFQPEELKTYHQKQLGHWKQLCLQRSFRGGGGGGYQGNRLLSSGNLGMTGSGGGMIGGMGGSAAQ
jgi:hypothetical protein